MTKLNVLISTIDERINNVKNVLLPFREDVMYIVSHQYTNEKYKIIPEDLKRKDVVISQIEGKGVTKSRNNSIRLASGEIGLFSDDDVRYNHSYFDRIISIFENDQSLDVALFKIKTPDGFPEYKKYPQRRMKLRKIPFYVGTIEIAFRVESIKKTGIFFDERFGAGQPLLIGGDESIFIHDCIKSHLNVWYFPEYIVEHEYESTAKKLPKYDKRKISVYGAYDARLYGFWAIPKAILLSILLIPKFLVYKKNPFEYYRERMSAIKYIFETNKIKD